MPILFIGVLLLTSLLSVAPQVDGTIETIAYKGSITRVACPGQIPFTLPRWTGPPSTSAGTLTVYTNENSSLINPVKPRVSYDIDMRSILVRDTDLSDTGTYRCISQIHNFVGDNVVTVRIRPDQPIMTTSVPLDDKGIRATEGQAFSVTCTSNGGYPAPTVTLYKGSITNQVLKSTNTGRYDGGTFTVTLTHTITPTRQDDGQQLLCRSFYPTPENAQDSQIKNETQYLYLKPLQPMLTQNASVVRGNDVVVECKTVGSRPAANISWVYQGQTSTTSVIATGDPSTVVSVFRRRVAAADNGQTVQCRVIHTPTAIDLTGSAVLNVLFPVYQSTTTVTGNMVIIANGINPLTLNCSTGSSNPPSDIAWKNGTDVIKNNNIYTEWYGAHNGVVRSQNLTLQPTRYEHGNNISCLVSNGILQGHATTYIALDIHYSPIISDIHDTNATEGDSAFLQCNADSKPLSWFTWNRDSVTVGSGNGTPIYNGLDYIISHVNRSDTGIYTCTADNQIPPKDSKQTMLTVLYPPDIFVIVTNTSVLSHLATVTCEAYGVPEIYTYQRWVHTWFDGQVVSRPVQLPNTKVLKLTNLTYAHSGVYTCWASNGVKGPSHGSASLFVKSPPVLVGIVTKTKEIEIFGELLRPSVATFQYYSNAGRGSVSVYKNSGIRTEVGQITIRDVVVKLPVFLSEVTTGGIEATITILTTESHFGTYNIIVTNDIGAVDLSLVIHPTGPPDPPFDMNITVLDYQSVLVMWKSGFPNGLNQTFVIQLSTDTKTWNNFTLYGGMSFRQTRIKRVSALTSSQVYDIRMLSVNDKGESKPTAVMSFKTEAQPVVESSSPIGFLVGGVAIGVFSASVVFVVIVIWKRKRKGLSILGKRHDRGTCNKREKKTGLDDENENAGVTDNAVLDTHGASQAGQQYEELAAAPDKRLYDQLDPGPVNTSGHPNTYENSEQSPYQSLQTSEENETRTYEQVQQQGARPTVYENLDVTSAV